MFLSRSNKDNKQESFKTLKRMQKRLQVEESTSSLDSPRSSVNSPRLSQYYSASSTDSLSSNTTIDFASEFETRKVCLLGSCRKVSHAISQHLLNLHKAREQQEETPQYYTVSMRERLSIKTQIQHITKEIQVLTHLFEYFFRNRNEHAGRLEKEVNHLDEVVKKVSALHEAFIKKIENGSCSTVPTECSLAYFPELSWEQLELSHGIHCIIERKEKKDGMVMDRQSREKHLMEVIGLVYSEVES